MTEAEKLGTISGRLKLALRKSLAATTHFDNLYRTASEIAKP